MYAYTHGLYVPSDNVQYANTYVWILHTFIYRAPYLLKFVNEENVLYQLSLLPM